MAPNVSDAFRSLPMEALIGEPFKAACSSNQLLANAMYDYVMKVGYNDDGKTTRLLTFNLDQPITDAQTGQLGTMNIKVNAPFLGLTPIPSLLIDDVTVDFTMTVSSTQQDTTSTTFGATAKGGIWGWSFSSNLSVSDTHMRQSNQSATYTVHVEAKQQPQTEGLSKLMDIMANCIAPMSGGSSGGGG